MPSTWWLYLLRCDDRIYTGISTDPVRRHAEHAAGGARSARFTRGAKRLELVFATEIGPRELALRAEHRVRRLPKRTKEALIVEKPDGPALLGRLGLGTG